MKTSVVERKLTDGSVVYAVVFVDGSQKVIIECVTERDALALQEAFEQHASYADVWPNDRRYAAELSSKTVAYRTKL